jgi:transposase
VNTHSRARTTPLSRELLVRRVDGWTVTDAADKASVSVRTGCKWLRRANEGPKGLLDRVSVPGRMPRLTDAARTELVFLLRHGRLSGPGIARVLRMSRSTVARVLEREGLCLS